MKTVDEEWKQFCEENGLDHEAYDGPFNNECEECDGYCMDCDDDYDLFLEEDYEEHRDEMENRETWKAFDYLQMKELKNWLRQSLARRGCDNHLTLTKMWLEERGQPFDKISKALKSQGGYCDCEVLMNVHESRIYANAEDDRDCCGSWSMSDEEEYERERQAAEVAKLKTTEIN